MTHVVILGAGFAGLELSTRLSESLSDEVRVTLIDQNESFSFGFSKLDILLGRIATADVLLHYREISKGAVEFRQERVMSIDPEKRQVTTDATSYDADILVVALGADYDFAATPGFQEGGVEYYSIAGAERMRDVLTEFDSGKILIGILGHPFKCPPAPFEGALLLHDHFVERGVRESVEIRTVGPIAAPVPITKELSQSILDALTERGIEYMPNQHVVELDSRNNEARFRSGGSVPYDLFVGSRYTVCPMWSRAAGLQSTAGCRWRRPTWRPASRTSMRWETSPVCQWRRPVCSRRPPLVSWRTTSPRDSVAAPAALRGCGQLLHRVRRRDGWKGRGQLLRRANADGAARRAVARARRGQGVVRVDTARALVRVVIESEFDPPVGADWSARTPPARQVE